MYDCCGVVGHLALLQKITPQRLVTTSACLFLLGTTGMNGAVNGEN
jgi:hypothetical protein